MNIFRRAGTGGYAVLLALLVVLVLAVPAAIATNSHWILGPPGYQHGNDVLIVAGSTVPTLDTGDQVVICHAIGMTNRDGYVQNDPAAGVVFGHAGMDHQAGEDIIPPFIWGTNRSLEHGQNWTAEGRLIYENGCNAPGALVVHKHVVGGTAAASAFTLHVDAAGTIADQQFAGSEEGTTVKVPFGPYTVTELAGGPAHYVVSYSAGCAGTIVEGAAAVCTVTNTYQAATGSLTVKKVVVGGSAVAADFQLRVDAAGTIADQEFAGSEAGKALTLPLGAYAVTELAGGPAHYVVSYSAGCAGTIVEGAAAVCTVTNTYQAPTATLVVEKQTLPAHANAEFGFRVTPEGGTAVSFTLNAKNDETAVRTLTLPAGTYSVAEEPTTGWRPTGGTCTTGDPAKLVLEADAVVRCVFTNERIPQPAALTVVKTVVGGAAAPADFTIDVSASGTTTTFPGSATGHTISIPAGAYTVGEHGGPGNYTASYSADCSGTLAEGGTATCTVTNTYHAPQNPVTPETPVTPVTPVSTAVDLTVQKSQTRNPVPVGETFTYVVTVTNTPPPVGPAFTATDVTVTDQLPATVRFLTATPTQGTCTLLAQTLTCKLGSIEPGAAVFVLIAVRPTVPGALVNTASATSFEPELNPADNSATVHTTVAGAFTPPVTPFCSVLHVAPISMQVGRHRMVLVRVRDQRGRPLAHATVTIRGPGVDVRGTTAASGVYRRLMQPKKPGVLVVRATPSVRGKCTGRLGVVGVFQPPVTG